MRPDAKKNKAQGVEKGYYMPGASGMLPVQFEAPLPPKNELKHQSMKSLTLLKSLLKYFTRAGELILDQFSGSFVTSTACDELGRYSIGIEKDPNLIQKAQEWFTSQGKASLSVFKEAVEQYKENQREGRSIQLSLFICFK